MFQPTRPAAHPYLLASPTGLERQRMYRRRRLIALAALLLLLTLVILAGIALDRAVEPALDDLARRLEAAYRAASAAWRHPRP